MAAKMTTAKLARLIGKTRAVQAELRRLRYELRQAHEAADEGTKEAAYERVASCAEEVRLLTR